jgi:hypothetical protein
LTYYFSALSAEARAVGTTKLLLKTVHVYRLVDILDFNKKTCPVGDLAYILYANCIEVEWQPW